MGQTINQNIIKVVSASRTTAKLMKTGQTTSYRTGDDGDIEAGRDFFTLAENNPFGNTNRFTDELGGQTYTNNIVIDWSTYDGSTVLGYSRIFNSNTLWGASIDYCTNLTQGGYSNWRMPNFKELVNVLNFGSSINLDYSPFNNLSIGLRFPSSTNDGSAYLSTLGGTVNNFTRYSISSTTCNVMPVRDFTVIGTTLT